MTPANLDLTLQNLTPATPAKAALRKKHSPEDEALTSQAGDEAATQWVTSDAQSESSVSANAIGGESYQLAQADIPPLVVSGAATATPVIESTLFTNLLLAGAVVGGAAAFAGGKTGAGATATPTADTTAPAITSVAITGASGVQNSSLNAGDVVSITITLSEATTVTTTGGAPQLALNIGGTTVQANYASGSGSTTLVFSYTVLAGQTDANGISLAANSLSLNGATLKDAAGNNATLTHAGVADNAAYLVDAAAPSAPTIAVVAGDDIINASEVSSSITGSNEAGASVALSIGGNTRTATVSSTSWSYTLVAADIAAMGEGAETLSATQTDAAGNTSAAGTRDISVDTTAPTFTSAATATIAENTLTSSTVYDATADSDVGVNYTLTGADAALFNIAATTGLVTFKVSPNFEIPTDAGANNVYDFTVTATDASNNATSQAVQLTVTDVVEAGQAVIDLGSYGKLIAPVQVEGKWYYFWDRSGDGTSDDIGSLNGGVDYTTHNVLDSLFNLDINRVPNATVQNVDGSYGTTDSYRYATINGVSLALPTAGGQSSPPYGAGGINSYQPGTTVSLNETTNNDTYNDLLAVWDAYNGSGTGTNIYGTPAGWQAARYWSATPSASGHADVHLDGGGYVFDHTDSEGDGNRLFYVALQVL